MNTKFKFTGETKVEFGVTLNRIEAIKDFGNVSKGEKGGWIEKETNIDVYGDAWVYGNARVYGNAWVYGDARVYGNAWVYGNARVYGKFSLSLGYFFGTRFNKEEIKYHTLDENTELIYKGDAKIELREEELVEPVEEKEVIELNGKKYQLII